MLFQAALTLATILCWLVTGFLFAFAVVVMPGIRNLDDASYIRAFQAIDRVIENNQPLFVLMWVGAVLALIAAAVLGFRALGGGDRLVLALAALGYLVGVQLPTMAINVPLNKELQRLDVASLTEAARQQARAAFEPRWNRWNVIRTVCAGLVSTALTLLLLGA